MHLPGNRQVSKRVLAVILAGAVLLLGASQAFGSSTGMNSENPLWGSAAADFPKEGCTHCHGTKMAYAPGADKITWSLTDAEGQPVTSAMYEHDAVYTFDLVLEDEIEPGADNHAGFLLIASDGEFVAIDGTNVKVTGGGLEASHSDASTTSWQVEWHAPEHGAVAFTWLVNDVDGSNAPDEGDLVYREIFGLTDADGATLGAATEEHVEFGISLQQYWIGLIGLLGMVVIMLAGYIYMKYVNPHHTGPKDR